MWLTKSRSPLANRKGFRVWCLLSEWPRELIIDSRVVRMILSRDGSQNRLESPVECGAIVMPGRGLYALQPGGVWGSKADQGYRHAWQRALCSATCLSTLAHGRLKRHRHAWQRALCLATPTERHGRDQRQRSSCLAEGFMLCNGLVETSGRIASQSSCLAGGFVLCNLPVLGLAGERLGDRHAWQRVYALQPWQRAFDVHEGTISSCLAGGFMLCNISRRGRLTTSSDRHAWQRALCSATSSRRFRLYT